jgi:hypothetical protein
MEKFKVGERVRYVQGYAMQMLGKEATIKYISGGLIYIEFDEPFDGGHDGNGHCRPGCGRRSDESCLELVEQQSFLFDEKEYGKLIGE